MKNRKNKNKKNKWFYKSLPNFNNIKTNDEFMDLSVYFMNQSLYCLKTEIKYFSEVESNKKLSVEDSVIVGHMIRITKLYEGLIIHIVAKQGELAFIFTRMIYEASIRMRYLINSENFLDSVQSYIFTSYRAEKDKYIDLREIEKTRKLIPIEKRMLASLLSHMKRDHIDEESLMTNKNWKLDGKTFKDLCKTFDLEKQYIYLFAVGSGSIHGNWFDLINYHLQENENSYSCNLSYRIPDPRYCLPISIFTLQTLIEFNNWSDFSLKNDNNEKIKELIKTIRDLDMAHEETLRIKNEK